MSDRGHNHLTDRCMASDHEGARSGPWVEGVRGLIASGDGEDIVRHWAWGIDRISKSREKWGGVD